MFSQSKKGAPRHSLIAISLRSAYYDLPETLSGRQINGKYRKCLLKKSVTKGQMSQKVIVVKKRS